MTLIAAALAILVGLSLGLLGGGGSILTVPIFVYVLGFQAKEAIASGLAVVGAVSLFGAAGHWRAGNVALRPALLFGVASMTGALAGARLATVVSGRVQLFLFAIVMLLAAVFMLRGRGPDTDEAGRPAGLRVILPAGLCLGVLTGLVGVGGGFLIVPALVLLAGLRMKQAVGTSLAVIAMNSFTGLLGYRGEVHFDWGAIAAFTSVAIVGSLVGVRLVSHVPQRALQRGFAVFLLAMGMWIVYQNRAAVLPQAPPAAAARPASR
ncbi:sulfite exporter TauE/SafE family protein [Longimicrobium sp.]|uniref:sulfite exporter TauE/SafE family protein n=1 Tax=Longimicrobium sp. TaxID=2029185 RepID=UPI003B3AEC23